MKHVLLALAIFLVGGCADSTVSTDHPVPSAAQADVFGMAPEGVTPVDIGALTEEERSIYGKLKIRMWTDLQRAMATPGGWRAVDQATRPLLDDYPALNQYEVYQIAATMMLRTYLLDGALDADKAEALGFYTDLLVEHGSPNAPLVERALAALEGHWTKARIAETARAAADAGERYAAKEAECPDCDRPAALRRIQSGGGADTRAAQVAAASERLRALAD